MPPAARDPTISAVDHCDAMAAMYPDLGETFYQPISTYCQQKLWHQLTVKLLEFVKDDTNVRNALGLVRSSDPSSYFSTDSGIDQSNSFLELYEQVVYKFEDKLHPLSTARIADAVACSLINKSNSTVAVVEVLHASKALLTNLMEKYQQKLIAAKLEPPENSLSSFRSNKKKDSTLILMEAVMYLQSKANLVTLYEMLNFPSNGDDAAAAAGITTTKHDQLTAILKVLQENGKVLQEWSTTSLHQQLSGKSSVVGTPTAAVGVTGVGTATAPVVVTDAAIVLAAHYEQGMAYYKLVGPPELFYEQAMQFLTYAPPPTSSPETVPAQDASMSTSINTTGSNNKFGVINYHQLAVDLCLAALTGDGVYNLGQVEQTPAFALLQNTTESWLIDILLAVSYGDVVKFQMLTIQYATQIQQQPALTSRAAAVEEKLTLMALIEYIVKEGSSTKLSNKSTNSTSTTSSSSRLELTLSDIATALHRPLEQVEFVIMRACSVNLLIASIDQVDSTVLVKWVMPRVLNSVQMVELSKQFQDWSKEVLEMESYMKEHTQTLFA